MSRTAIVTISCPHCGGRTDNVRSIEAPQSIPCPYCRTELHVPRVGERIVERERVVERVVEVEKTPEEVNWVGALAALVIAFVGVLILAVMRCQHEVEGTRIIDSYEQKQQQRATCKQQCPVSCPAADKTVQQLLDDSHYSEVEWNHTLARDRCVMDCELACYDITPRPR